MAREILIEQRLKHPDAEHGEGDQQSHSKQNEEKPVERQLVPHEPADDSGSFCHRMLLLKRRPGAGQPKRPAEIAR